MTLATRAIHRYRTGVRFVIVLFAAMAIILSGVHAGPAEAHESDPIHAGEHHAHESDSDGGSEESGGGDQHGCHNHCPSAPASSSEQAQHVDHFVKAALFAPIAAPLLSTSRAPPLTPPKP